MVRELARRINQGINSSATASDTALLAAVVLIHPRSNEGSVHGMKADLCLQKVSALRNVLGRCGELVGWSVSAGDAEMEEGQSETEIITSRIPQRAVADEARKRPADLISSAVRWGFLQTVKDELGAVFVKPAESAQLNLWWYRGTIFHLLAVPGIVATILVRGCIRDGRLREGSSPASLAAIETQAAVVRSLWEDELFWPETTSTAGAVSAVLQAFQELGILIWNREAQSVSVADNANAIGQLQWLADLVRPEIELYSIQLGAAVQVNNDAGLFKRDEVIGLSVKLHRSAFLRGHVRTQSQLSHVFGGRTYDAFLRAGVFVSSEGAEHTLSYSQLSKINQFLQSDVWQDYSL